MIYVTWVELPQVVVDNTVKFLESLKAKGVEPLCTILTYKGFRIHLMYKGFRIHLNRMDIVCLFMGLFSDDYG